MLRSERVIKELLERYSEGEEITKLQIYDKIFCIIKEHLSQNYSHDEYHKILKTAGL